MCHLIQIGHEIVEASQAAGPKTHQSQMFFEVAFDNAYPKTILHILKF